MQGHQLNKFDRTKVADDINLVPLLVVDYLVLAGKMFKHNYMDWQPRYKDQDHFNKRLLLPPHKNPYEIWLSSA